MSVDAAPVHGLSRGAREEFPFVSTRRHRALPGEDVVVRMADQFLPLTSRLVAAVSRLRPLRVSLRPEAGNLYDAGRLVQGLRHVLLHFAAPGDISIGQHKLNSGIPHQPASEPKTPASRRSALLKLGAFVFVVAMAFAVASQTGLLRLTNRDELAATIERVRTVPHLALLFVVAYALAVTFGLPATAFTLAGGVIFGFGRGLLFNWLGAMAGAVLAYFFAGAFCGDACRVLLGRRANTLRPLAEKHGFRGICRLRLIPVIPFGLLNYGAALAGVKRRNYVMATALGILPGSAVYTYFAGSLVQGVEGAGRHALINISIAGTLLILLSFLPKIVGWVGANRRPADAR